MRSQRPRLVDESPCLVSSRAHAISQPPCQIPGPLRTVGAHEISVALNHSRLLFPRKPKVISPSGSDRLSLNSTFRISVAGEGMKQEGGWVLKGFFALSALQPAWFAAPCPSPAPRPFLQSCPRGEGRGRAPTGAGGALISALHTAGASEQFLSESLPVCEFKPRITSRPDDKLTLSLQTSSYN